MVRIFLSKINDIAQFSRKIIYIIFLNKNLWGFSNARKISNLIIILKTIYLSLYSTLSALKFKFLKNSDKQYLYTTIKNQGHQVEKLIFFPKIQFKNKEHNVNYIALKKGLKEWRIRGYEKTKPIKWAIKVLEDYENYFPDNCPNCRTFDSKEEDNLIKPELLLNLIKKRRSRRFYSSKTLDEKEKVLLVESANYAPTSCNRQSTRIIFVEEPNLKRYVSKIVPGGKDFFDHAPTIMLILADKRDYRYPENIVTPFQDSAAAMQNILLLAETMNLACCWGSLTSFGDIFDDKDLKIKLNIPDYFLITGSIAIGHKEHETHLIPRDLTKLKYSTNKFKWNNK
jgi:nitroreductase